MLVFFYFFVFYCLCVLRCIDVLFVGGWGYVSCGWVGGGFEEGMNVELMLVFLELCLRLVIVFRCFMGIGGVNFEVNFV